MSFYFENDKGRHDVSHQRMSSFNIGNTLIPVSSNGCGIGITDEMVQIYWRINASTFTSLSGDLAQLQPAFYPIAPAVLPIVYQSDPSTQIGVVNIQTDGKMRYKFKSSPTKETAVCGLYVKRYES